MKYLILALIITAGLIITGCQSSNQDSMQTTNQIDTTTQSPDSEIVASDEIDPDIGELDDLQVSDEIPE